MQNYQMLAAYNAWANRLLYAAVTELSEDELHRDTGAFFGSVFATLSHILVADRVWLNRFTGEGPVQTRLDEILFDDSGALSAAREVEDERIIRYVEGLSEADLASTFSYRTITGAQDITQPLAPALSHFFNHQTHHRGQTHALLSAIAGNEAAPSLDLLLYQRETGVGMS